MTPTTIPDNKLFYLCVAAVSLILVGISCVIHPSELILLIISFVISMLLTITSCEILYQLAFSNHQAEQAEQPEQPNQTEQPELIEK